jgi:hypothetical protein
MTKSSPSTKGRSSALLSASALAATALIATAGPAGAVVTSGGAADAEGRPGFVRDAQGVALALCADAVNCEPADPADPLHGGYFGAEAQAGPILAIFGIETAAGEDAAGNPTDQAVVANVARFRGEGLQPGGRYIIQHPWGRQSVFANDQGEVESVFEAGGEAGTALGAGVVKTFLRRTTAPAGFLGNLESAGPVTGSPTGFNRVVVRRPNGTLVGRTSAFTVNGQLRANTAMTSVGTSSLSIANRNNTRPVTRTIRYASFGTAAATPVVRKSGANPAAFTVANTCGSVAPRTGCNISVTFHPRANRSATAVLTIDDNGLAAPRQVRLTGTGPDTLRPRIAARSPKAGAANVSLGRSVMVRFNEAVRGVKGSFTLMDQGTDRKVRATVQRVRQTDRWVLNPRARLSGDTTYKVVLNGGAQALRDASGNAASDTSWRFHTR